MSENRPKPYLGNPQETIAVLNRYKFAFQKKFGQNFLISMTEIGEFMAAARMR